MNSHRSCLARCEGEPEEAYRAALHLAKRFEEEGLVQQLPPQDYSQPMPGRGGSGRGQSAQGQGGESQSGGQNGAQEESTGQGPGRPSTGGQEEERKGRQPGQGQDEQPGGAEGRAGKKEEDSSGQGSGRPSGDGQDEERKDRQPGIGEDGQGDGKDGLPGEQARQQGAGAGPAEKSGTGGDGGEPADSGIADDEENNEWLFGNEVVDAAVSAVERDAAYAIEAGVRGRSQPTTIGKPLHRPLPDEPVTRQRYRDETGMPVTVPVYLPVGKDDSSLQQQAGASPRSCQSDGETAQGHPGTG